MNVPFIVKNPDECSIHRLARPGRTVQMPGLGILRRRMGGSAGAGLGGFGGVLQGRQELGLDTVDWLVHY